MTNLKQSTYVDGIAASEALDSSGERLLMSGVDISSVEAGRCLANYEHKSDTPASIVGKVIVAKKIFKPEDCESERQLYFWNKVKIPYIYVIVELFDAAGHDQAKEVAAMLRYDESKKDQKAPVVNFSIEGQKLATDKETNTVTHSIMKKLSLTVSPCNKTSVAEIYRPEQKRPVQKSKNKKFDTLFKSETGVEILKALPKKQQNANNGIFMPKLNLPKGVSDDRQMPSSTPTLSPNTTPNLGNVIGKTRNGHPVFGNAKPGNYTGFNAHDHHDAMNSHYNLGLESKDPKIKNHHLNMARFHGMARDRAAMKKSLGAAPGALVGNAALEKEHLRKDNKYPGLDRHKEVPSNPKKPMTLIPAFTHENIHEATGVGEEWLLDRTGKHVIAKFIDGNIAWSRPKPTAKEARVDEDTKVLAASEEQNKKREFKPRVFASDKAAHLSGVGEEALLGKDGKVRFHFSNGNIVKPKPELKKAKNVRKQKQAVWGGTSQPAANSPMREKHTQHIRRYAKDRYGLDLVDSGGKWDEKKGQRRKENAKIGVDKPDWRSGQLEAQNNPDAQVHELGHLDIMPRGLSLPQSQKYMDQQYADVQRNYGYMKQKQSQGEIQPMGVEQLLRRRMGLPANRSEVPVKPGQGPRMSVDTNQLAGTRITKPSGKIVDLIRQSRFVSPENRERVDMIDRGELKYDPQQGWVEGRSVNSRINRRAREASKDVSRKDHKTLMRSEINKAFESTPNKDIILKAVDAKFPEMRKSEKMVVAKIYAYRDFKKKEMMLENLLKSSKDCCDKSDCKC